MSDLAPQRKVTAGVLAGAVATLSIYLAKQLTGSEPPAEVGAAFATLVVFALSYITPAKPLFTPRQHRLLVHLLNQAPDSSAERAGRG